MKQNNIDRIDFCNYRFIDSNENILYKDYILIKNNDVNNFIYNVGTALYNTEKYINLLSNFDYEYREIELKQNVQEYALNNMNCYYINYIDSSKIIKAGYYAVTDIFVYMHLSHGGGLMPVDNNKNNMCNNLQQIYENIINNYSFNRNIKDSMH